MSELLTAAQMRDLEAAAIRSGKVTGLELMERAGRGVVAAVFDEWPELAKTSHRAVVLCGPGNNGGDGFVVARLLKEWGWQVEVFLYGDAKKLPPDARVNYERWGTLGPICPLSKGSLDKFLESSNLQTLWVDALFGTGLRRPIEGAAAHAMLCLRKIAATHLHPSSKVVAIDMPSGICSDSGRFLIPEGARLGEGFQNYAHLTVSFHSEKIGHRTFEGALACGRIVVSLIGLSREPQIPEIVRLLSKPEVFPSKWSHQHKFDHGHALILTGGAGKTGAARLAARGALRIGAGLVTLGVPHEAQGEVAAQITAVMMREVGDAGVLKVVLEDARLNALCVGPGLGFEAARELVPVVLGGGGVKPRPTVLDADALSAFGDAPEVLFDLLHEECVLTPHGGEFARLFPDIAEKLNATPTKGPAYSKVDAAREAAARAGCVVLLKGPDTVIAAPDGRCGINSAQYERSASWLATAGSGDVLAGFITGLLARGLAPMQAAEAAAWLHVECARKFGPGLISEDIPEQLPAVFRDSEV